MIQEIPAIKVILFSGLLHMLTSFWKAGLKGGSLKFGVSGHVFEESSLHWLVKTTKIITIGATGKKL